MTPTNEISIDEQTISRLGLRITQQHLNAGISPDSKVFEYPHLENVFVMESDLYGNPMPESSCFLAFNGKHGLVGKHMTIQTLANSTVADIRHIVETNTDG
ncbi:MAG: hypothetical protein EOP48_09380 [Sphingobacteriales bacterium]|nr:MAG: hypothetical protein EOP48_09380 [Sphingobacteriales bacterium]